MWHYSSCEVRGKGHIKTKRPCQDKTKAIYKKKTYVIALSDGAGSAEFSRDGASCVVDTITKLFTERFDELFSIENGVIVKEIIMKTLLDELIALSETMMCDINKLASTLLAVAVNKERFIVCHIGDGVIGYLYKNELKVASSPRNGEYANETHFVTSKDAMNYLRIYKGSTDSIGGFVIMSDGTQQSLYNKMTNSLSNGVLKLMLRNNILDKLTIKRQLKTTFNNTIAKKTFDDCSIALLTRENEYLHSYSEFSYEEKCELFGIDKNSAHSDKHIKRMERILDILKNPVSIKKLSVELRHETKDIRKYLNKLIAIGLVKKHNGFYSYKKRIRKM